MWDASGSQRPPPFVLYTTVCLHDNHGRWERTDAGAVMVVGGWMIIRDELGRWFLFLIGYIVLWQLIN